LSSFSILGKPAFAKSLPTKSSGSPRRQLQIQHFFYLLFRYGNRGRSQLLIDGLQNGTLPFQAMNLFSQDLSQGFGLALSNQFGKPPGQVTNFRILYVQPIVHRFTYRSTSDSLSDNEGMKTRRPDTELNSEEAELEQEDLGPNSGGQSSDNQGLSDAEDEDSESVDELVEEGQYLEAGVISGIENAPPADAGEVTTRQFPVDDVPLEYLEED
jgi:hypothetical protein